MIAHARETGSIIVGASGEDRGELVVFDSSDVTVVQSVELIE